MSNVIKFYPWDSNVEACTLPPTPAVYNTPAQWKEWPRYIEDDKNRITVKHCMPFFDAMTAGYHYLLPCDITVTIKDGIPDITWEHELTPLMVRDSKEIPAPIGYYDVHFSWQMWWGVKLPDGWSALVTNPLNQHELPFKVTSGIVDFDVYTSPGNIGFFSLKGFEGTIPAGTPIFQIIPIKRAEWVMELDNSIIQQGHADHDKKLGSPRGFYKKHVRQDKKYS